MDLRNLSAVTGASGYTGKYITRRLLALGHRVISLTGHPDRPNEYGDQVRAIPFNFENPAALTASLQGVETLYNTYWVRFEHGETTFEGAIKNTMVLIQAAESAGVSRIVHVSITNADAHSPLPYFRGKGLLEEFICRSGLSYAILRPTVIFGREDILINNIAFLLRKAPVFAIPSSGDYRLQPIYVEDMSAIAVRAGQESENIILDAVGPQIFTYKELVRLIADKLQSRARIIHVPPGLALFLSKIVGKVVNDVVLTKDELRGLMAGLLVSKQPPTGQTALSNWLEENASLIGQNYTSELSRHYPQQ